MEEMTFGSRFEAAAAGTLAVTAACPETNGLAACVARRDQDLRLLAEPGPTS